MLYVCVRDMIDSMDVVFSVCIVTRGAVGKYECFVVQMLCLVCILSQFSMLHSA